MLDKNVYINMDAVKYSVRQANGVIQINDVTVTGRDENEAGLRLDRALDKVFFIISKYNQKIVSDGKNKKTSSTSTKKTNNVRLEGTE